ncbi:MAG TPA: hypothetical protein VFP25_04905 [Nitrososphaeraceae archaeon]|nr:hypothetical protein [Nitrososphaeraceae archaeon]
MIKFPENVIYHSSFVILIFVLLVVITPMHSYSQDTGNIINPNEQQVDDLLSEFIQETKENVNATIQMTNSGNMTAVLNNLNVIYGDLLGLEQGIEDLEFSVSESPP